MPQRPLLREDEPAECPIAFHFTLCQCSSRGQGEQELAAEVVLNHTLAQHCRWHSSCNILLAVPPAAVQTAEGSIAQLQCFRLLSIHVGSCEAALMQREKELRQGGLCFTPEV